MLKEYYRTTKEVDQIKFLTNHDFIHKLIFFQIFKFKVQFFKYVSSKLKKKYFISNIIGIILFNCIFFMFSIKKTPLKSAFVKA